MSNETIKDKNIELWDVVRFVEFPERIGVVESIIDYGTHVCYFVNIGKPLKYPCRLEWIELVKKGKPIMERKEIVKDVVEQIINMLTNSVIEENGSEGFEVWCDMYDGVCSVFDMKEQEEIAARLAPYVDALSKAIDDELKCKESNSTIQDGKV